MRPNTTTRKRGSMFSTPAKPTFKILATSTVVFMFTVGPVLAGQYELVKGKGMEVCEAYEKNLNSFKPTEPMRCDRLVNPDFKDFQKPKWVRIDGLANYSLIESAYVFLEKPSGPGRKADLEGLKENIKAQNEPYTFSTATVDIDNDGKPERVLRYFDTCIPFGTKGRYGTPLLVVSADGSQVDSKKSRRLMSDNAPLNWGYLMYDAIIFKNDTYFDYWVDYVGSQELRVSRTHIGVTSEICRYKYIKP